ncbi:MAG: cyclic nucleotide-binding domain-containing protein [Candidatus Rokubacteria bacterium]|nr:cyclic nucleotide-binding domain-containing protein [Candidatus Rokubacteria bacterium]
MTDLAVRAGAKRVAFFHHDPAHADAWIRQQTERAQRRAQVQGSRLEIFAAAEGLEVVLAEPKAEERNTGAGGRRVVSTPTGHILVTGSDPTAAKEVRDALAPDSYRVTSAYRDDPARLAAKLRPDLMIVVGAESQAPLLQQAERVRAEKAGARLPVLVLAGAEGPGARGHLVGDLTDVLSHPFNPAMLRSRVRAWLSRSGKVAQRQVPADTHPAAPAQSPPGTGLLKGLPFSERAALLAGAFTSRFRAGEIIFRQGDAAGGVYFLRSGRVEISIKRPAGRRVVLAVAKAGDTVGELAALDGGVRTATAKVLQAASADYVPADVFQASLAAAPGAVIRVLRLMAARLRQTDGLIGELTALRRRHRSIRSGIGRPAR